MVLGLRDFSPGQNPPEGIGKGAQLAATDPKFETENAQPLHFLRHHLSPTLKDEYMAERSASSLWTALKQRFERLKYTVKPCGGRVDPSEVCGLQDGWGVQFGSTPDLYDSSDVWYSDYQHSED